MLAYQHVYYVDYLFAMLAICGIINVDIFICVDLQIAIIYISAHNIYFS